MRRAPNFSKNKFGDVDNIVQIDETMLNHQIKRHLGRVPTNKTDALCIVEVADFITRAYACVILNKRAENLIPPNY